MTAFTSHCSPTHVTIASKCAKELRKSRIPNTQYCTSTHDPYSILNTPTPHNKNKHNDIFDLIYSYYSHHQNSSENGPWTKQPEKRPESLPCQQDAANTCHHDLKRSRDLVKGPMASFTKLWIGNRTIDLWH